VAVGLMGVVMLLGLSGCGSSSAKTTSLGGASQSADIVISKSESVPRFDPNKVSIPLNKDVTFTVLNKDTEVHNITIPGVVVDMDIAPGQRVEVKIPAVSQAPRDGFFLFYCKYHQQAGETGHINISK
jgi:plastocyanin